MSEHNKMREAKRIIGLYVCGDVELVVSAHSIKIRTYGLLIK